MSKHVFYFGKPDKNRERERWTVFLNASGQTELLRQDFVTEQAFLSKEDFVRPGREIKGLYVLSSPPSELPDNVRKNLHRFLGERNA